MKITIRRTDVNVSGNDPATKFVHYIDPTVDFVNHLDQVHSFSSLESLQEPNENGEGQFDMRVCVLLEQLTKLAHEERVAIRKRHARRALHTHAKVFLETNNIHNTIWGERILAAGERGSWSQADKTDAKMWSRGPVATSDNNVQIPTDAEGAPVDELLKTLAMHFSDEIDRGASMFEVAQILDQIEYRICQMSTGPWDILTEDEVEYAKSA